MKDKKHGIIAVIIVIVALVFGILAICFRQEKAPADIPSEEKQEHDEIIGDEDLDEIYHVIDEYIEKDTAEDNKTTNNKTNVGNQSSDKNTNIGNGSVGDLEDDEEGNTDSESGNEDDNTENDNTGEGEEEPSTGLESSKDENGNWGDIKF